jgi:hypothetical protein
MNCPYSKFYRSHRWKIYVSGHNNLSTVVTGLLLLSYQSEVLWGENSQMEVLIIIGLTLIFVAGFITWIRVLMKQRQEDMQAVAENLNLQYSLIGNDSIAPLLANLEFFSQGTDLKVNNLIRGNVMRHGNPVTVAIFDYQYTLGLDRKYTRIRYEKDLCSVEKVNNIDNFLQTVIVLYDESLDLPGFKLRPRYLMDKLENLFRFDEINFDDYPDFSKDYRLQARNVGGVEDLFQPNLIRFYEGNKICTEANGNYVVIYPFNDGTSSQRVSENFTDSRLVQPDRIKFYLNSGLRLLNLLERNLGQGNGEFTGQTDYFVPRSNAEKC